MAMFLKGAYSYDPVHKTLVLITFALKQAYTAF